MQNKLLTQKWKESGVTQLQFGKWDSKKKI